VQADAKGNWQIVQLPQVESALVSVDTDNGAIRALVGGFGFYRNKYNHVTQARRQPGSSFKPFIYSAALEKGFTPATIINDAPLVFDASQTGSVFVLRKSERDYQMWYTAAERYENIENTKRSIVHTGYSTSTDGIEFAAVWGRHREAAEIGAADRLALGLLRAFDEVVHRGGDTQLAATHRVHHRGLRAVVLVQVRFERGGQRGRL